MVEITHNYKNKLIHYKCERKFLSELMQNVKKSSFVSLEKQLSDFTKTIPTRTQQRFKATQGKCEKLENYLFLIEKQESKELQEINQLEFEEEQLKKKLAEIKFKKNIHKQNLNILSEFKTKIATNLENTENKRKSFGVNLDNDFSLLFDSLNQFLQPHEVILDSVNKYSSNVQENLLTISANFLDSCEKYLDLILDIIQSQKYEANYLSQIEKDWFRVFVVQFMHWSSLFARVHKEKFSICQQKMLLLATQIKKLSVNKN